ncbi:ATP-binding protein (plasmid) [Deinococcus sp. KNUC1210]|uniref:sensor histidine kinase n=1 Tax=Deinococcus sp. KNUC1210 TaxID=2917691 RepID=UPI001EF0D777|nr:ATP-binding protein [Deinococcus sp. KNUC1210]ULH17497.1 ATP-binding protein [Deinococcus sp. KNUC1210]
MSIPRLPILVVDDNDSGRYITVHTLTRAGYQVIEARSGAQAFEQLALEPALIVLDINLPDMNGFEVCSRLKSDPGTAQVPVLMASASYLTAENTAYGLNVGADAYLAHPIEPAVLLATVQALLRVRAAEAEVRQLNLTLEHRVRERTEELERLNQTLQTRNEELAAFSSSVSHDLRTPVRHIKGFSDLALRALAEQQAEKAVAHLQVVGRAAERMNTLIDGMLRLSMTAMRDIHRAPVSMQQLLDVSLEELTTELIGRQIVFDTSPLPSVQGDRDSLQQVMTNLISNAVKYTRGREEARISIWSEEDDSTVTVSVQDNGVGFDPHYQSRLFGLFQRLHAERDFEGTGVGLAIVRRVIEQHGGQVAASGQLGVGATFSFRLPKEPG